jgi:hypothetical protein
MTTLVTATPPRPGADKLSVPWRKLAWVTWRQHRFALTGAVALTAGACLVMLINGLQMRSSLSSLGLTSCHPMTIPRCSAQLQLFQQEYSAWGSLLPGTLLALPALIGVFVGGPMLAREFETGTFRFAWTQGAGRVRWITAKIVLLAVSVTVGAALFSVMFSWWYQPFFAQGASLLAFTVFPLSGAALPAWSLATFTISAFSGAVMRRTVPAMATALAATAGLFTVTVLYLRPHYQAPIIAKVTAIPDHAWVVSLLGFTDPHGQPISRNAVIRLLTHHFQPGSHGGAWQWLVAHGYSQWASYQPEGRFWPFQLTESGWLLALALLLGGATVWLVRHRAA